MSETISGFSLIGNFEIALHRLSRATMDELYEKTRDCAGIPVYFSKDGRLWPNTDVQAEVLLFKTPLGEKDD